MSPNTTPIAPSANPVICLFDWFSEDVDINMARQVMRSEVYTLSVKNTEHLSRNALQYWQDSPVK
jgi:hypothetical protein